MSKLVIALLMSTLVAACGGGNNKVEVKNDTQVLDVAFLLNGPSEARATSYWQCLAVNGTNQQSYTLSAYADGTGQSSQVGTVTWRATDRTVEVTSLDGAFIILEGFVYSVDSQTVKFKEYYPNNVDTDTQCVRQAL